MAEHSGFANTPKKLFIYLFIFAFFIFQRGKIVEYENKIHN